MKVSFLLGILHIFTGSFVEYTGFSEKRIVAMKYLLLLFLSLAFNVLIAQDEKEHMLTSDDVTLFISSYTPLNADLIALGETYSEELDSPSSAQEINEAADSIFRQYGWEDGYMKKYNAVFSAFSYVAIEKQLENTPESLRVTMSSLLPEFKKSTNENDILMVRARYAELNELIGANNQ